MKRALPHGVGPVLLLLALSCGSLAGQADTSQPPPLLTDANKYPAARHGGPYMWNYYIPPAPGTTPWAPCWSPDGKRIAVAMQGSIWIVDPRTGAASEATTGSGYASSPTWSPDGKWIVYTADYGRKRIGLEAVEVSSGESHVLTGDDAIYLDPQFSSAKSKLPFRFESAPSVAIFRAVPSGRPCSASASVNTILNRSRAV